MDIHILHIISEILWTLEVHPSSDPGLGAPASEESFYNMKHHVIVRIGHPMQAKESFL